MGFTTQTLTAKLTEAKSIVITNAVATLANTEYSHSLQSNLKRLIIKARGLATLKVSFVIGDTATSYVTIHKGNSLELSGLDLSGATIYYRSSAANETLEVMELV